MNLCGTCHQPMQFEGGHHPPPGSAFEPWCATCADHPFVPEETSSMLAYDPHDASRCATCGRDIHADFQVAGMLHYGLTESVGLHPFVPASVEDDEDGPLLTCERCGRGVNLLVDGLCDACESTPAGEGAWETARTLMRAIEDIREPGARTYPVMVALANHEAAIRAPLEAERDRLLEFKDAVDRETAIIGAKVENIAANSEAIQWLLDRTKARVAALEDGMRRMLTAPTASKRLQIARALLADHPTKDLESKDG